MPKRRNKVIHQTEGFGVLRENGKLIGLGPAHPHLMELGVAKLQAEIIGRCKVVPVRVTIEIL